MQYTVQDAGPQQYVIVPDGGAPAPVIFHDRDLAETLAARLTRTQPRGAAPPAPAPPPADRAGASRWLD